jgi:AcrR family transcriptional regulator
MAVREEGVVVVPTGRHGLPVDVVAEHQRERLLAATIAVVAKRGYRSTTVDHIVKKARVGYVAFYELFTGKEDCFAAAFERIVADLRAEWEERVAPQAPWAEQICIGLQIMVEAIAADPARARVGLVEAQTAGPEGYRRYEDALEAAQPKLREGRELRRSGETLTGSSEEATVGSIAWIFRQRLVNGEGVSELLGQAIQIALSPYLGDGAARKRALAFTAALS